MTLEQAVVYALTREVPADLRPAKPVTAATRLTRREWEVVALISQGLSNREIATRLCITQTTAGHHVENILAKLGMSSRTKVATWALHNLPPAASALGGGVYAAVAFAGIALNVGIRTMSDDTYQHRVFPELIHAADDAGYVMHATGAAALGAMIIASSLAFLWARVWPTWAGWLGIVVGILAIASIFFFPQFLYLAWILVVSLLMFFRPSTTARAI